MLDAGRLGQHGVLPSLAALLEPRLKLAFPRRDDLWAKDILSRLEMLKKKKVEKAKLKKYKATPV